MPEDDPRWIAINEKLSENDHARIVERQVNGLDRATIDALYHRLGKDPYDPVVLLKMVLYQYLKGNQSPATWEEQARRNEAMMWLGRGYTPARRTWYDYRDRIGDAVEELHQQHVRGAIDQEHLDPSTAALDGTFVAACASRHRMVNQETLLKRQGLLQRVIQGTTQPTEELPKWIPPTPSGRLGLAGRLVIAAEVLADGSYCSVLDLRDAQDRNIDLLAPVSASGTTRQSKSLSGEVQIPREQFSFDAVSNSYTCPAGHRLNYKDREKKDRLGGRHLYQSRYQCEGAHCGGCPLASRCLGGSGPRMIKRLEGEELLEAQRAKMELDEVKQRYRLRGQTVERGFGDAKGNRRVTRFHGRGLKRARTETGLLTLAQNVLRLDNLQQDAVNSHESTT